MTELLDQKSLIEVSLPVRDAFALKAFDHMQELVKAADAKAGAALTALSLLTALVAGGPAADRFLTIARGDTFSGVIAIVVGLFTAIAIFISMFGALMTLIPRTHIENYVEKPTAATGLLWLNKLKNFHRKPDAYVESLKGLTADSVSADFAYETLKVSWILEQKFDWLKWSLRALPVATLGLFLLIVLGVACAPISASIN